jgi:DnaJ-class molecular chaperone
MEDATPGRSLLTRIFGATGRIGEILHRRADARAHSYGWEIVRTRSGLGRTYRDERWRRVRRCPRCAGEGLDPLGEDCRHCTGTGRVLDTLTAVRR